MRLVYGSFAAPGADARARVIGCSKAGKASYSAAKGLDASLERHLKTSDGKL